MSSEDRSGQDEQDRSKRGLVRRLRDIAKTEVVSEGTSQRIAKTLRLKLAAKALKDEAKEKAESAGAYIEELKALKPPDNDQNDDPAPNPIETINKIRSKKAIIELAADLNIDLVDGKFGEMKEALIAAVKSLLKDEAGEE